MTFESISGHVIYGAPDYEKVRKIMENGSLRDLLRRRIDANACWYGKPGRIQFDELYDEYAELISDYLAAYDATQEIDAETILEFMPAKYTEQIPYDGIGDPADEYYMPPGVTDMGELYLKKVMNIWGHERGLTGVLQDYIDHFMPQACTLEEAKAFNRLCKSESEELSNNAVIAEYIVAEGLAPLNESDYQEALEYINDYLDQGIERLDNGMHLPDRREQKGLPTNYVGEL